MEDWEQNYMAKLAAVATSQGGTILELGYGMGISAREICKHTGVKKHFIVECHPDVMTKAIDDLRKEIVSRRVHLLTGFWEDVVPLLEANSFDGILFDTYPLTEEEVHANHFWFFEEAYRLLKPGGVLTYYSDEAKEFSAKHLAKLQAAKFTNIKFEVCPVYPPEDCEYWQDNTMIAPIITK